MGKNANKETADFFAASAKKKKKNVNKKPFPVFTVFCIVAGLLLVAIIGWNVYKGTGSDRRGTVVMTVGDTSVNSLEFQYFYMMTYNQYYQYLSYFGVDTASKDFLDQASTMDANKTWREYFSETAMTSLKQTLLLYNAAKESGLELDDDDRNEIQSGLQTYEGYAKQNSVTLGTYLSNIFGRGFSKSDFENMMTIALLANKMQTQTVDSYTYTDEQLESYYNDNRSSYDVYTYLLATFAYETPTDDSSTPDVDESQDTTNKDAAKAKADAFLASVEGKSREEFVRLAQAENETFTEEAITKTDVSISGVTPTEVANWLKETGRGVGDTAVLGSTSGYYVPYFVGAHRDDYKTVNLRIITVNAADVEDESDTEAAAAAKEAAQTKAQEIYTQWQQNGATEDAFTALVSDNSADSTTKSNGGLLNEVQKSSYTSTYGSALDTFAFDSSRAAGDCQVIETNSGFALVYFVSYGEEYWKISCRAGLKSKDFSSYLTQLEEKNSDTFYENVSAATESTKG